MQINIREGDTHVIVVLVKDQDGNALALDGIASAEQTMVIKQEASDANPLFTLTGEYPNGGADGVVTFSIAVDTWTTYPVFNQGTFVYGIIITTDGTDRFTVALDSLEVQQGI